MSQRPPRSPGVSRRRLLAGAGIAAAGLAAGACGGGGDRGGGGGPAAGVGATTEPPTTAALAGDPAVARLVAGLEQMAIDLYDAFAAATAAGVLGQVPLAVAAYVTTARSQHAEHLGAWNEVLQAGGQPAVTTADAGLKPVLAKMLADAKDVAGAVAVAETVEEILADTYLRSIPTLADKGAIRTAGQILVVDQQHRAVLNYVLGRNPAPEPVQVPDMAAS